jgi:hypothetical protein
MMESIGRFNSSFLLLEHLVVYTLDVFVYLTVIIHLIVFCIFYAKVSDEKYTH